MSTVAIKKKKQKPKHPSRQGAWKFSGKDPNPITDFRKGTEPFLLIDPPKKIGAMPCDNCGALIDATSQQPCPICGA